MMTPLLRSAGLALALALAPLGLGAAEPSIFATWLTEGGEAHIAMTPCGKELCGHIIWLADPYDDDGNIALDEHNPDPALRHRPILGMPLLRGFIRRSDGEWRDGKIYNPDNGKEYSCTLRLRDADTLALHCYVFIPLFGETQLWKRVAEDEKPPPEVRKSS